MLPNRQNLIKFLKELGLKANKQGFEIYIVGGFVRDLLLGDENPKDLDLVINTNAIDFAKKNDLDILESFENFGTVKLKGLEEFSVEIASARQELYVEPASFPKVELIKNIPQDLPRRDFTINTLLISVNENNFGDLCDPVSAKQDLENKIIKVFHDKSFIDDPTRIYRAARFMAKINGQIDPHTCDLIQEATCHKDFRAWYKKRKNRFEIEMNLIEKLDVEKKDRAKSFLTQFKLLDI